MPTCTRVATAEGLVLAAGARGLSTSTVKGATWSLRTDGLEASYSRAAVVCGDRVLVSRTAPPRRRLSSGSRERRLRTVPAGLAEWFDDNIDTYCLDALNDGSYAAFGTGDGPIYGSDDGGLTWLELITPGFRPYITCFS